MNTAHHSHTPGYYDVPIDIAIPAAMEPITASSDRGGDPHKISSSPVMDPSLSRSGPTGRNGKKKKSKSKATTQGDIINDNNHPTTTAVTTFEEMKLRDRSKSPFRRLLRNLSKSPLRRRSSTRHPHKKNMTEQAPGYVPEQQQPQQEHYVGHYKPRSPYPQQPYHADGIGSFGTADYLPSNTNALVEYMVDPLGSVVSGQSVSSSQQQQRPRKKMRSPPPRRGGGGSISSESDVFADDSVSYNSGSLRDTDSLVSRDSASTRGSRRERPAPIKVSSRRMKIQERTPTPKRRQALPSVREDGTTEGSGEKMQSPGKESSTRGRKSKATTPDPVRKASKPHLVWTKYPSPEEQKNAPSSSAVPKMQPATSTSSMNSEASLSTRVLLLLVHPASKFFELIQLVFSPESSTLGDLLDSIPAQATEGKLAEQQYTGLVRASKRAEAWTEGLQPASDSYRKESDLAPAGIVPGDVLIAIPQGYSRRNVVRLGLQILESPRIKSLLVDKFRAEMNVPDTITTRAASQSPGRARAERRKRRAVSHSPSRRSSMKEILTQVGSALFSSSKSDDEEETDSNKKTATPEHKERRPVTPVRTRSLMAADAVDKEDSSSWEDPSNSSHDAIFLERTTPGRVNVSSLQHTTPSGSNDQVSLATSRSLMAFVSVDKDQISSTKDVSNSETEQMTTESTMESPGSSSEDKIVETEECKSEACAKVNSAGDTLDETIDDSESVHASETMSPDSVVERFAEEVETEVGVNRRALEAGSSPVRQRILALEEKIAVCPTVPVPLVGPHDFSHSEEADEISEDLPELVETPHKDDSEEADDGSDSNSSENVVVKFFPAPQSQTSSVEDIVENDDAPIFESLEMTEHREILREALARAESLPAPPPPTLEMFVKGEQNSIDDDEATVVTKNTVASRAPMATARSYDAGSVDLSYSAWSHSVDSSLVSRYSLVSHSSKSLMTEEEFRTSEARVKAKQRRRYKAKLVRSLKKLGLSALGLMVMLYWLDPRRKVPSTSGEDINSPLGMYGILQFVLALCVLMKAQMLSKRAAEMKSGTCPFTKAVNVFIEGLNEKQD